MGNDFTTSLRPAIVLTVLFAILLGIVYPLVMTGIGQAIFPHQANGSLITVGGKVIGSDVVGQGFVADRYFQTRPSAAGPSATGGYDGLASGGSNLGPDSRALADRVRPDVARLHGQGVAAVPGDLVTASGSGLDPDLTPAAAFAQVPRVARVRRLPEASVRALVEARVRHPLLGFIGADRVNVLALNRALDGIGVAR